MRVVGVLVGLVVAGTVTVCLSVVSPGPEPTLVTAGAGLVGTGIVGLAVEGIDTVAERYRISTPLGRLCRHRNRRAHGRSPEYGRGGERGGGRGYGPGRKHPTGLSKADRLVVALGAGAVFVRVTLIHLVANPLQAGGAALTLAAVVTIGVVVGYRTAGTLLDGLRHGVLACGLGGALCVSLAAYDAATASAVASVDVFDAVVVGSGLVLPVAFGLFGGLSGVVGWWLADLFAGADPLA